MKRRLIEILALLIVSLSAVACGGNNPVAPTPTQQTYTPPLVLPTTLVVSDVVINCVRGYCASATGIVTNTGPGCVTNVQVLLRWYGADGAIPLPNSPDVAMFSPSGLSTYYFGSGSWLIVSSVGGFNDVRSAHTVYRPIINSLGIPCR